jgi:hypothetical protein
MNLGMRHPTNVTKTLIQNIRTPVGSLSHRMVKKQKISKFFKGVQIKAAF